MHVTVFTQSCQKFFPSATILGIRHFHTTTPLIHFTKASSGSHKLTVKWISSIIVVFQCLFLSSIYPGNHCRSDPVQVQSTIGKVQNRLPKQINMICMHVFLWVPLRWQICAHRNKARQDNEQRTEEKDERRIEKHTGDQATWKTSRSRQDDLAPTSAKQGEAWRVGCNERQHQQQLTTALFKLSSQNKSSVTLMGVPQPTSCNVSATREIARASSWQHPPLKNKATSKSPVGDISVVTLIRTDTTLDHSQKAEKVCLCLSWQRCSFLI